MEAGRHWDIDLQKTKVDQNCYIDLLKTSLLPECCQLCPGNDFEFKTVLHHTIQKWCNSFYDRTLQTCIADDEWASYSPHLNPLDYCISDILQDLVYEGWRLPYVNLLDLKEAIKNKWKEVTIETVRKLITQWKKTTEAVRKQNGGVIQNIFR